jgi:hypothetical protein
VTLESRLPRPRSSPEDADRSAAPQSRAVAELHTLVAELELATRAVRTLGSVVAALDTLDPGAR